MRRQLLRFIIFMTLISACHSPAATPTPPAAPVSATATRPAPTATAVATNTTAPAPATPPPPTAMASSAMASSATNTPWPTVAATDALPHAGPASPTAVTPTVTPTMVEIGDVADWLYAEWQAGADPAQVWPELLATGRATDDTSLFYRWTGTFWFVGDLDGDGVAEWVTSIIDPDRFAGCYPSHDYAGRIWVINSRGIAFDLDQIHDETVAMSLPLVVAAPDMTGDGLPELITLSLTCGAHTNTGAFHIISGHGGVVHNAMLPVDNTTPVGALWQLAGGRAATDYWNWFGTMTTSPYFELTDVDGDNLPDLIVEGGLYHSAGAGYHRSHWDIWSWDGENVALLDVGLADTGQRIHRLYDANFAYLIGDLTAAEERFLDVIGDDNLGDDVIEGLRDGGQALARQMAAWRLLQMALATGDITAANAWVDWLAANYPDGLFTGPAVTFLAEWLVDNNFARACQVAGVDQFDSDTWPLADTYWVGYGNPVITAADLCRPPGDALS